jgi:hypothetical protein
MNAEQLFTRLPSPIGRRPRLNVPTLQPSTLPSFHFANRPRSIVSIQPSIFNFQSSTDPFVPQTNAFVPQTTNQEKTAITSNFT